MTKHKGGFMSQHIIDGITVFFPDGPEHSEKEAEAYIAAAFEKRPANWGELKQIIVHLDGEEVDLEYIYVKKPFERIRRITGYLVGTTDRFNNAKSAELKDRVKHGMER